MLIFLSTRKGRFGLGLPMACTLLVAMGGDLEIINHPTGGSAARVRLVRERLDIKINPI